MPTPTFCTKLNVWFQSVEFIRNRKSNALHYYAWLSGNHYFEWKNGIKKDKKENKTPNDRIGMTSLTEIKWIVIVAYSLSYIFEW